MRLKSLVVTDGVGNFENVDMVAAPKRIRSMKCKDRLFSGTYGETNAESEAYKKYIEPFE